MILHGPWFWPWWGGLFGLLNLAFWVLLIVGAVMLFRRELPRGNVRERESPALAVLQERYARGEITREEFLERRAVLLSPSSPPSPETGETMPPPPPGATATEVDTSRTPPERGSPPAPPA